MQHGLVIMAYVTENGVILDDEWERVLTRYIHELTRTNMNKELSMLQLLLKNRYIKSGENTMGGPMWELSMKKLLVNTILIMITLLVITILIGVVFLFGKAFGSDTSTDIEDYLNTGTNIDTRARDTMPALDNLPEYEDIEYRYTSKTMLLFQSNSVALIVTYDDKTYTKEKEKLAENYIFLTKKLNTSIAEYEFSVNSYIFNVVKGNEKDHTHFPKSFGMIGTSDEKQSIAYLYFHDFDLDYIGNEGDSSPMTDFVNQHFDYDF
ncbi:hypothetical protein [Aquibacillus rhizosphaerae]|uniref:Uncharacterized protein n=1 Tax=Aquibacillus rhizosphaerae TaxID=3051431 RepID=A0ABT7L1Y2_9BACI|nr:hypothetical protein [Aquibacillus sp. LR5S19]MDL4839868.1 hypothetical protein [Aquibacillus sp. LR5S19]